MPLVGGGGAGNVAGGNPSGTGSGLNYIGDHAYLSPTPVASQTAEVIVASFTTGAHYIVGTLTLNCGIQLSNAADIEGNALETKFNSEVVLLQHAGSNTLDASSSSVSKILIPPFTEVIMTISSEANDANNFGTVFFVGRVYA